MFRATLIFWSFKCTLQTIGVCTSFDVLLHWIGYWLGHPRTFVTDLDLDLTSSKQFITYLITGGKAGDLQMYLCPHF